MHGVRPERERAMNTIRLTMAQALVRYLAAQRTVHRGREVPLFGGVWAIFGHGNVAGRRRSAVPASWRTADLSCAQRAGDGARGDCVREGEFPAADDGVHDIDRSGRHQPRHGGGDRACQSAAGAVPSGRHLRFARARSGAAADRGLRGPRHFRERLLSAGVAVLRPHHGAGAAPHRAAGARSPS